jgi:hypothetical protein
MDARWRNMMGFDMASVAQGWPVVFHLLDRTIARNASSKVSIVIDAAGLALDYILMPAFVRGSV